MLRELCRKGPNPSVGRVHDFVLTEIGTSRLILEEEINQSASQKVNACGEHLSFSAELIETKKKYIYRYFLYNSFFFFHFVSHFLEFIRIQYIYNTQWFTAQQNWHRIEGGSCILPQCDHKYKHPSVDAPNRNTLNQSIFHRRHRHLPKCNTVVRRSPHDIRPYTREDRRRRRLRRHRRVASSFRSPPHP